MTAKQIIENEFEDEPGVFQQALVNEIITSVRRRMATNLTNVPEIKRGMIKSRITDMAWQVGESEDFVEQVLVQYLKRYES